MTTLPHYRLRLPRFLLLGATVMLVAVLGEWVLLSRDTGDVAPVPTTVASGTIASAPAIVPPPPDRYAEVTARPLFIPDRRPQTPDQAPAGPPPARPNVTLLGVVMTGTTHYALLRHGNPPKLDSLAEGQTVDGWQIQTVTNDHVTLRLGTAEIDFPLGGRAGIGSAPRKTAPPSPSPANGGWGGSPDL
jgi:hypothetical protein